MSSWIQCRPTPWGSTGWTGVPATSLGVVDGDTSLEGLLPRGALTFASPGSSTFDLRPGTIGFTTTRVTSGWGTWGSVAVFTAGSGGEARTNATAGSPSGGLSGSAWAMAPTRATRWSSCCRTRRRSTSSSAAPVTPWGRCGRGTVFFQEGTAFRMWIGKPYWWSGKPGSTLELHYSNWPAGTTARFLAFRAIRPVRRRPPSAASTSTSAGHRRP